MDFGPVRRILSRKLNDTVVVYDSSLQKKPGCVLKFYREKDDQ